VNWLIESLEGAIESGLEGYGKVAHADTLLLTALRRIARLREGNFGDAKPIGEGVHELRVHHGPGYRIYFGRQGRAVVILLCGGDKQTQPRDIARAKRYWRAHRDANRPLS